MIREHLLEAINPARFAERIGFCPDDWQRRALEGHGKRLLLNCSRQSGKSTLAALMGLHKAIFCPASLTLLVSPSLRQSGELFRKVTDLMGGLEDPPAMTEDNRLRLAFENGSRIVSLPGKESTIRGFSGVSLLIVDEAARVLDELYYALRPMLAVSNGDLIALSTPWGRRGWFFTEWTEGEGWERIKIAASECPRISQGFLEEERRTLGEWWYRQEYEAVFGDTVDSVFSSQAIEAMFDESIDPLFGEAV